MVYVYVLVNEKNDLYFGSTRDLRARLKQHNTNKSFSTQGHQWQLVYYEAYSAEKDARLREKKLKQFGQSIKHLKNRLHYSLAEISAG